MLVPLRDWSTIEIQPEDDACETCLEACEYCCNKRPLQTWFIILTFWATVMTSIVYFSTKQRHYTDRYVKRCHSPLDQTDDTNAITVLNYPLGDSSPYLSFLGLDKKDYSYSPTYSYPVITTVVTQKLFTRTLKFVAHVKKEIKPELFSVKMVIFAVDLTAVQISILEDDCQCEVRQFSFQQIPEFIKYHADVWQPLAIQILLKEYHFVIWTDPTVQHSSDTLRKAIVVANTTGIATSYTSTVGKKALDEEIHAKTLEKLGEVQCAFKGVHRFDTSLLVLYEDNSGYISRYIMRPWVSCGLTKDCMSQESTSEICTGAVEQCYNGANTVLSIILHRLYWNDFRDKGKFPFEIS